jgi:hypothetical protein
MQEPLFTMLDAFVVSAETQTEDTRQSDTGRMVPGLTARHWFGQQKSWAVELALTYYTSDIRTRAGKLSNGSIFATRLGFPIVFASTQHTAFEIIPQVSYLGAGAALAQQRLAVFEWDLALRLVAEIHFGFIGVPELSVLSGLGAMWSRQVLRLNLNR